MKVRPHHRRTAVVFGCGVILLVLLRMLNHSLSPWALSVWCGGLLVTFPALRLGPQQGFNACFLLGLMLDALSPFPFGLHAFLFGVAHLVIVRIRNRLPANEPVIVIVVTLVTNLVLFVLITFFALSRNSGAHISVVRLLSDLVLSQITIVLIGGWFLALQERALEIARVGLHDEPSAMI
ncbi:MAG: rod shape-determining protein MreD [Candidatus Synoicihabitans palmerolidicus]|nr:rod shape-determining protein MreD [Candidatus Synoicihabitans palmerolidicus]